MFKNIIILFLILTAAGEGYLLFSRQTTNPNVAGVSTQSEVQETPRPSGKPPVFLSKGAKFADSPISKNAYQIAPGELSAIAKKALSGWNIKTQNLPDGSTRVNLIPKESDDTAQQYTVRPGNTLYFVEITFSDDPDENTDKNLRDDYGILVDKDGNVL